MSRTYRTWDYSDDQGGTWSVKVPTALAAQVSGSPAVPIIGGALATSVHPPLRHVIKPRVALVQEATTGKVHRVVCMSPTSVLYTVIGTTVSLYTLDGGSEVTCTMYSAEGERKRAKKLTS